MLTQTRARARSLAHTHANNVPWQGEFLHELLLLVKFLKLYRTIHHQFEIWDTAGQERFDSLSSFYCRGARAAIICYDLTDRSSFDCIQSKWIKKVVEEAEQGCHMCLVGTKVDLVNEQLAQRAVRKEEVDALAAKHKAHSFETSAKQGSGVGEIFQCIVEGFQARVQAVDDGRRQGLATGATHKQGGCC